MVGFPPGFGLLVDLHVAQLHTIYGRCTCTTECKTTVWKLIPSSRASVAPVNTVKVWLYNVTCYMYVIGLIGGTLH